MVSSRVIVEFWWGLVMSWGGWILGYSVMGGGVRGWVVTHIHPNLGLGLRDFSMVNVVNTGASPWPSLPLPLDHRGLLIPFYGRCTWAWRRVGGLVWVWVWVVRTHIWF